ncbi:transcription termination/antitermination protein NusG [Rhizobium sp. ZK1]|uniref:transcription termination/antitermination protein NusG n=1 Tax=Rhizobium sp. ZK1 TaxID=3389872 RepID=UPI0039F67846
MMMQHDKFDGSPVAVGTGERFDDRMRRIRADMLHFASRKARDDSPWFAIRVMSGREKAVNSALEGADIEALVPMRMGPEYRRRGRVIPPVPIPVMTGYVLVRFAASDEAFLAIRGLQHVIDVLGGCSSPMRIADCEVKRFKALADDGSLDWEKPTIVFRKGEQVRISAGPLVSLHGRIITCRSDGKGDAVVEVMMFGRETPTLVPLANLEKV